MIDTQTRKLALSSPTRPSAQGRWWANREAALNWLALGMLLAAWNAVDGDSSGDVPQRPEAVRHYRDVSVRAVQRSLAR